MKPVGVGVTLVTLKPAAAMALLVPVNVPAATSVAVRVWLPGDLNVALKTPTPPTNVALAGKAALGSLLVKWIVPL